MSAPGMRLGPPGYVGYLLLSLVLVISARGWRVAIACAVILALAAVLCPAGLATLRSRRLWLFLLLLVTPAALFLGADAQSSEGLQFSLAGLAAGIEMALRALSIMVAVAGFSASVSVSDLSRLLEGAGLRGLGFALGVAFNMLPTVQNTLTTAFQSLRLRGGFRRQPLLGARLLLITVIANSLRHADDIVGSAEARAFSTERAPVVRMRWHVGDLAVVAVLAVAAVVLWLV